MTIQPPSIAQDLPPHFRWNFTVLIGDAAAWMFAVAFVDVLTVLPIFFQRTVDSLTEIHLYLPFQASLLAGLAVAIRTAGWFIPQFFSARKVSASARKKPVLLYYCWIARLPFLFVSLYLFTSSAATHPGMALLLVLAAWTMLSFGEGFSGVPWMDIISRTIPAGWRGRLFGGQQILGGLLACAAGLVVNRLLGPQAPPYPRNFAILFGCLFLLLMVSQSCLLLIREPTEGTVEQEIRSWKEYLRDLPPLLQQRAFRSLAVVQLLASVGGLASPLYTLFALQHLHAPASIVGRYLSVTMAGTVLGSLVWGFVSDHFSPRLVIRLNLIAALLAPWAALFVAELFRRGAIAPGPAVWAYSTSFFLSGVAAGGQWAGYNNYVLETAPEGKRPEYIGLMNTLSAPTVLMPLLGAWLAGPLTPEPIFLFAGLGCTAGLLFSARLP